MNVQGQPPPTFCEKFSLWWNKLRTRSKVAIILGGLFVVFLIMASLSDRGNDLSSGVSEPPPDPSPTLTQAESRQDYVNKMMFACSYAVPGGFDRDRMVELAEYDYGVYGGIIVKSYLKKKDIGRQCHDY